MKIKKQLLIIVCCLLATVNTFGAISYTLTGDPDNLTLTITGTGDIPWFYSGTAPWRSQINSIKNLVIEDGITGIKDYAFVWERNLKSLTIGNSVTYIGAHTFENCNGLTGALTIPDSVTSIGNFAFSGCSGLTSLTIGNSVTSIGYHAFEDCTGLTSLTIGNSVTSIRYGAFDGCIGLTGKLIIPNSVISIEGYAFNYCTGLTGELVIPNSVTTIGTSAFGACRGLTSLIIGNSVTSIESSAFMACSGLTSLTIGNSVTSIGRNAFYCCASLTGELIIPNSVTSIGDFAFWHCMGFTSLTIGNSVTSIGVKAFDTCTGLIGELVIPNSVTSIGDSAFDCCTGLTGALIIPNSVTLIGNSAFAICRGFTSLTIGNSVTTIGNRAFYACRGFTSLTIGNSVTTIENSAFYGCSGLTSLTIGNSVTSIGNVAFLCTNLMEIYSQNTTPPQVEDDTFYKVDKGSCILYVPAGSAENYRQAPVWQDFGTIIEVPAVVSEETQPVAQDGKGIISLRLSIPGNATLTGSFEIQFPEGMTLNEELTTLSEKLSGNFSLSFTAKGNNTWLIEIVSNGLRSSSQDEYSKIVDIAFDVTKTVSQGSYDITLSNLDFRMDDHIPIKEESITVTVNVISDIILSVETIRNTSFYAYFTDNTFVIESPQAESITIYSITGVQLYAAMKNAGTIEIPFTSLPIGSVFIVKGSVSGTRKVIKN